MHYDKKVYDVGVGSGRLGVNPQYLVNVIDVLLSLTDCTLGGRLSDITAADQHKTTTISDDLTSPTLPPSTSCIHHI